MVEGALRWRRWKCVFLLRRVAWVEVYILKGRLLWAVDSGVGRSWCLRAILQGSHSELVDMMWRVGGGGFRLFVRVLVLGIDGYGFLVVRVGGCEEEAMAYSLVRYYLLNLEEA
ncbi:uncharacterized protein E6C27_scaffold133G00470 [Cucumis melo var. makuwa]|uniref:Uncharacterized protein n=1 Tax=Cucumis melo var. makuwa TaxID=1194695 RepID=A0A5A7TW59_CUCMM|nr:uncharacterized protein E6C27_scaffold133G00470 [Cucumis melo var. makuwa]